MSSEDSLVSRLKTGDIKAFEELVELYDKKIYNYAYGFTLNHEDSLDITQEVFLKVYKNIGKFKENASLSTWIYKITSNVCIDVARKNNRHKTVTINSENEEFINQIPDKTPLIDEIVENNELSAELSSSMKKLDFDAKQIIVMRDVLGLSYSEIGDALKLEDGTVKSKISRSRKKLREILLKKREQKRS
ncbi:MAG: RNA polymerase sigma factor [Clostridia bacterium]